MDTYKFLTTILPATGTYFLFLPDKKEHRVFIDLAQLAEAAQKFDAKKRTTYFACAAYKHPHVDTPSGKKYRDKDNYQNAKAFWCDIDCGEDKAAKGIGYATKKDAVAALAHFCSETAFPLPMIVDSGYGIHCYWPLTTPIGPNSWRRMAFALKQGFSQHGLLVDPTRTADMSSVLRPAGTHNYKHEPAKLVTVKREAGPYTPAQMVEALRAFSELAAPPPSYAHSVDINDDLTAHRFINPVPSYGSVAANKCHQMALMRDTGGDVGYEHWRGVIGVLKHCEDGRELADQWSNQRAATGHAQTDVAQKWNTWSSPPATCEFFGKANPGGCDGCGYRDKIKSPIVLGRQITQNKATEVTAVVDGVHHKVEIPALPSGYAVQDGLMVRLLPDKDDLIHVHPFSPMLFYPTDRIRRTDGSFELRLRAHLPDGRVRRFEIDTSVVGTGGQKLVESLASYEVMHTNNKDASVHMSAYLRDSVQKLITESQELSTMATFGWKNDRRSFLLGDRLYEPDGTIRTVLTSGYASQEVAAFDNPTGTPEGWAMGVNFMYARPGMECMQYALCSGFGSVLGPFVDSQYKGIPLALTGSRSGRGKTTVCQLALAAFGNPALMTINGDKGATENARYAMMGAYQNLPLLMDEVTNMSPEDLGKLLYAASNGRERRRLTAGGRNGSAAKLADTAEWNLSMYLTANKYLAGALSAKQANTEAEAVRFIEIQVDVYEPPELDLVEVATAVTQVMNNVGKAGEEFIKYVVTKPTIVFDIIQNVNAMIVKRGDSIRHPQYRFYRNHMVVTVAAAVILRKLKLVHFDVNHLLDWALRHMQKLTTEVVEMNTLTENNAISQMITDLASNILCTREYRATADPQGPERAERQPLNTCGRYVLNEQKIYLARERVREWCIANRMPEENLLAFAKTSGILLFSSKNVELGRGTLSPASYCECIGIDMAKMPDLFTGLLDA